MSGCEIDNVFFLWNSKMFEQKNYIVFLLFLRPTYMQQQGKFDFCVNLRARAAPGGGGSCTPIWCQQQANNISSMTFYLSTPHYPWQIADEFWWHHRAPAGPGHNNPPEQSGAGDWVQVWLGMSPFLKLILVATLFCGVGAISGSPIYYCLPLTSKIVRLNPLSPKGFPFDK